MSLHAILQVQELLMKGCQVSAHNPSVRQARAAQGKRHLRLVPHSVCGGLFSGAGSV